MTGEKPLAIAETFVSIQGEGKLTGVPSFFVRVSGCNLRCRWCDAPYTSWKPERTPRTIDELMEQISTGGVRHVVITGGEPMLFEPVEELCRRVRRWGGHITIETAGTIFRRLACDLMSLSPKLANSAPEPGDPRDPVGRGRRRHERLRINIDTLQRLIDAYPERQFKFVVTGAEDFAEIERLMSALAGWSVEELMVMPEGVAPPDRDRVQPIVRECIRRGWRYCHRVHIDLFGNTRRT